MQHYFPHRWLHLSIGALIAYHMYKLLQAILAVTWGFHSHQSMSLISDRPFDRCLTSSLISYIVNTTCASGLIHYCTILCSTPHYCTALCRSWRRYVEAPEPVELAPGPLCFHRKADRTQYSSMRKLLHVPGPDNHCFASVKNAAENKPSASA